MSDVQDLNHVEADSEPGDELASEELDQVVGGTGPAGGTGLTAPTLPPVSSYTPQTADGSLSARRCVKCDIYT